MTASRYQCGSSGKAITAPTLVSADDVGEYIGAFVVANDVSARDIQLPQGQFYKGKSYRTFCPVGPYLCIPDANEVDRWRDLRLTSKTTFELRIYGGAKGTRTPDPHTASVVRYQLRHSPVKLCLSKLHHLR